MQNRVKGLLRTTVQVSTTLSFWACAFCKEMAWGQVRDPSARQDPGQAAGRSAARGRGPAAPGREPREPSAPAPAARSRPRWQSGWPRRHFIHSGPRAQSRPARLPALPARSRRAPPGVGYLQARPARARRRGLASRRGRAPPGPSRAGPRPGDLRAPAGPGARDALSAPGGTRFIPCHERGGTHRGIRKL